MAGGAGGGRGREGEGVSERRVRERECVREERECAGAGESKEGESESVGGSKEEESGAAASAMTAWRLSLNASNNAILAFTQLNQRERRGGEHYASMQIFTQRKRQWRTDFYSTQLKRAARRRR